jgi:tellurite resistance protein
MDPRISEAVITRDYTLKGIVPLPADDVSNYLAVLARLAALDGFNVAEEDFIHRVAACLGLDPGLARRAGEVAGEPSIPADQLVERIRDDGLKLCLLRDAYRLAAADSSFSAPEIRELGAIARALGIDSATAAAVKAIALQEARLQGEFAQLVRSARA